MGIFVNYYLILGLKYGWLENQILIFGSTEPKTQFLFFFFKYNGLLVSFHHYLFIFIFLYIESKRAFQKKNHPGVQSFFQQEEEGGPFLHGGSRIGQVAARGSWRPCWWSETPFLLTGEQESRGVACQGRQEQGMR